MRICFITTGDIEQLATMKRAIGMAQPLLETGIEVSIIALDTENNRKRILLEAPNVATLFFKTGNFKSEVAQKNSLIEEWQPDVIYVCAFVVRNYIYKKNLKGVLSVVEHSELRSAITDGKWYKRYIELFLENMSLYKFSGQVLASRYLEEVFQKKLRTFKIKRPLLYSPYAYNKEILQMPSTNAIDNLRATYGGKKVILYMGTLSLNYGFLDIIKAVEILTQKRTDVVLLIMGNGRHKSIGKEYINEQKLHNTVKFLGYIAEEELSLYFGMANAFVSPINNTIQDRARCPSKLFMYLAFKRPVITCKVGEAASLFKDNGYYYQPGNTQQLSQVMAEAIDSNLLKHDVNIQKHTWGARTQEFINWINDIKK